MLLASTGARATEALSIRVKDIDFKSDDTAKLFIRGEFKDQDRQICISN
jgi:integrase